MKVIFDLCNCGLGNNGGSLTVIKSANTLKKLGHDVTIIDSMKNQHTWTKLKCEHITVKNKKQIPDSDVIIATGIKTVSHVQKLPQRCGKKFWWIRGHEIWNYPEYKLNNIYQNTSCKIMVNSICLKELLKNLGVNSKIIRPGNDLHEYKDQNTRKDNKVILGGLHNLRHRKIKRMDWIFNVFEILKKKYPTLELWMMGGDKPNSKLLSKYFRNPTIEEKNILFSTVHIWLAPTSLEGLHIPPQEAMLCNSSVVGTNTKMSGMQDYLIDEKTGLVATNYQDFIRKVERLLLDKALRKKLGKSGRSKIVELGSREKNMALFVRYLEENV